MFLPGLNFILILKEYFIWWVMTYRTSSFLRFEHVIDSLDRTGNTVLLLFWNLKKLTDVRCLPGCFYQMISKNLLRAKFSLLTYSKIWGERYKWCRECHESAWAGGVQVLIIRLAVFFKKPFLSLAHCEVYLDKKKKHTILRVTEKRMVSPTETAHNFLLELAQMSVKSSPAKSCY